MTGGGTRFRLGRIVSTIAILIFVALSLRLVLGLFPATILFARGSGSSAGVLVLLLVLSAPATWCASACDEGRYRAAMLAGLLLAVVTGALIVAIAVQETAQPGSGSWLMPIATWTGVPVCWLGVTALLLRQRQPGPAGRAIRSAAITLLGIFALQVALAVTAVHLSWPLWNEQGASGLPPMAKLLVATGILAFAALLGSLIMSATAKSIEPSAQQPRFHVRLVCPRCERSQRLASGGSPCEACGLIITVEDA